MVKVLFLERSDKTFDQRHGCCGSGIRPFRHNQIGFEADARGTGQVVERSQRVQRLSDHFADLPAVHDVNPVRLYAPSVLLLCHRQLFPDRFPEQFDAAI